MITWWWNMEYCNEHLFYISYPRLKDCISCNCCLWCPASSCCHHLSAAIPVASCYLNEWLDLDVWYVFHCWNGYKISASNDYVIIMPYLTSINSRHYSKYLILSTITREVILIILYLKMKILKYRGQLVQRYAACGRWGRSRIQAWPS